MDGRPARAPGADLAIGLALGMLGEDARGVGVITRRPVGELLLDVAMDVIGVAWERARRTLHRLARSGVPEGHRTSLARHASLRGLVVGHG